MKKIAFVINGKIRNTGRICARLRKIFGDDYDILFLITTLAGAASPTAEAVTRGYGIIICVGGDGTLNEVVNGVMDAQSKETRVGVLPYGSGNDFAKTIGITFDLRKLKQLLEDDTYREIDLGRVSFSGHAGKEQSRYFVNIVDVGLGGMVVKEVNRSRKWFGTFVAYQWAIIRNFLFYRHQSIKASADTKIYTGKIMNYIVANGKYFGSGMGIAPDAVPDDGKFAIVIVGEVSLPFYLKSLSKIKKATHILHPQVYYESAESIVIESTEPQPIDMDGEYVGNTPMRVKIVPNAIRFLCERQAISNTSALDRLKSSSKSNGTSPPGNRHPSGMVG